MAGFSCNESSTLPEASGSGKVATGTSAGAETEPINPATGKPLTDQERQAHMDAGGTFDGETGAPIPKQDATPSQQAPAVDQQVAAEPPKATAMKGDQIAGELKGIWDKASADQGSMTGSPQVQQQIIAMAKAAGLAGRKIEGKQFYSKFLGKDI
jgi:hypothetical protein